MKPVVLDGERNPPRREPDTIVTATFLIQKNIPIDPDIGEEASIATAVAILEKLEYAVDLEDVS